MWGKLIEKEAPAELIKQRPGKKMKCTKFF
jgi:hypothetical protein